MEGVLFLLPNYWLPTKNRPATRGHRTALFKNVKTAAEFYRAKACSVSSICSFSCFFRKPVAGNSMPVAGSHISSRIRGG